MSLAAPEYLVGSSKNMTGGLFTSSSAMARRFRWPPERLPVRVLAQDSKPRAVRISLTWGESRVAVRDLPPHLATTRAHVETCHLPSLAPRHTDGRARSPGDERIIRFLSSTKRRPL